MRKINLVVTILFFSFQFCGTFLYADEAKINATGYIKNFFIFTDSQNDSSLEAISRLRLRLDVKSSDLLSFEFAYELLPRMKDHRVNLSGSSLPAPGLLAYRAFDFDEILYPGDDNSNSDFILMQNLDRLYMTYNAAFFDLHIGRQPVSFGSARVINPTDIIAPFTYNTIAKEELVGVDALRVKTPLGEMGELDVGLVFGKDFEADKSAGFVRLKTYQMQTDITVMATIFRKNILLGIDLVRSIGGAGAWLEAAQVFAESASEENYFRLSIGSDYSLTSKLYAYIEYHYSGAGSSSSENYLDAVRETAFTDGAVYLLGRHYIAPGVTYEITPLMIFNAQALLNIEDGSVLFSPGFEYNIAENIYLQLSGFIGLGDESSDRTRLDNEFGLYPDVYYTAVNFYF